ncbi:MAG TPA: lipopolysaccharide biosynthesis protein [Kiritimatiellia bacterium]|nr:lipopolysaccharide biosynthesis protein [Kiritimatiellia bacterium]HMO99343.1 lipopolysaccharide biosynthesis protein [Kiritimatiellia bacterium]HMP97437.1 lipopolysaccharide biosynthesis protein [Kiritimatiellia bacterium]
MSTQPPTDATPSPDRRGRTLANLLFASFGYVAIRMLIAPVRIKLLTTLLTKEDYARLTLIMLTVSFITLISSLGSLEYMLRKIPGQAAAFQHSVLRTIMTYFGLLAGVIGLVGAGLLVLWAPEALGLSSTDIVACGLILIIAVHLTQIVYFLMGRSAYAQSRMLMLFYADAWFLPVLAFMWFQDISVSFMLWLWVVWLMLSVLVSRYLAPMKAVWQAPASQKQLREILVFGIPLLPMIMGEWIFQVIDRYVLVAFSDLEGLANFTLCFNIAWVGVATGTSMLDVLITEFYKTRNRVDSRDLNQLLANPPLRTSFTMLLRFSLLLVIPMVAALAMAREPIILLLSDPKFADAADLMAWIAPIPFCYLMVVIAGRTLLAIDRGSIVGGATLAAAGVHAVLSMALAPRLGERGVALSGCLAYGLLAIYLGARARLPAWVNWREFKPVRMLVFIAWCFGIIAVAVDGLDGRPLASLVVAALGCLAAMFGLNLVGKADIHHLMASMHGPSAAPETGSGEPEPFARD